MIEAAANDTSTTNGYTRGLFIRSGTRSLDMGVAGSTYGDPNYTDTSWLNTSATKLAFGTAGGLNHLVVNAGKVGIGTTNPQALLSLHAPAGSGAAIFANHAGTADYSQLYLQENGATRGYVQHFGSTRSPADRQNNLEIGTLGTGAVQFRPNDTAAMTVANGGSVGIATSNPASRLSMVSEDSASSISLFTSAYEPSRQWGTRAYKTDIGGGIPLAIDTQHTATWYSTARFDHGQDDGHPSLRTYFGTQLAVSGGNVGIGTTAPAQKLDVAGNIRFGSGVVLAGGSDGFWLRTATNTPNPNFFIGVGDGAGGWSSQPIGWNGMLILNGAGQSWCPSCGTTVGSTYHADMVINSSGSIGMGTTAPLGRLSLDANHVFGSKNVPLTTSWTTVLSVDVGGMHKGAYVKVFIGGNDWGSHSAAGHYVEAFMLNGGGGYGDPGSIVVDRHYSTGSMSTRLQKSGNTISLQVALDSGSITDMVIYEAMGSVSNVY